MTSQAKSPDPGMVTGATTDRTLRRGLFGIVLVCGLLAAWLLFKPGTPETFRLVDNLAQTIGPALALFWRPWRGWQKRSGRPGARRFAPCFLWLAVLSFCVGQGLWTYSENMLHKTPLPSCSDAAWLGALPCILLGILLLPTRPIPASARLRITLDGLIVMTSLFTFSWYFLLGPNVLAGSASSVAKIVSVAYPLLDLTLAFCVLALAAHSREVALRQTVRLLIAGLVTILLSDVVCGYQSLHESYVTGTLLDVGWPLGYSLVALGGRIAHLKLTTANVNDEPATAFPEETKAPADAPPTLWRLLLPYALLPMVGLLVAYTAHKQGDERLEPGVILGGGVLIGLVLLRQVCALLENRRLYQRYRLRTPNWRSSTRSCGSPMRNWNARTDRLPSTPGTWSVPMAA